MTFPPASEIKIRLKVAQRLVFFLTSSIVLMAAFLLWGFSQYRRDVDELVQYFNALTPTTISLHQEHFRRQPELLHLLWWHQEHPDAVGLKIHHLFMSGGKAQSNVSNLGIRRVIEDYNKITLAQACYLVQQGERSKRLRSIFMLAEALYHTEPERSLASAYASLAQDTDPGVQFSSYWKSINHVTLYKDYISAVVLPKAEQWDKERE